MKKLNEENTHYIEFSKDGEKPVRQGACGKTDLINIIREVLRDGYTEIKIKTIKAR